MKCLVPLLVAIAGATDSVGSVSLACSNTCRPLASEPTASHLRAAAAAERDGYCDDGGMGAEYSICFPGTDCHDCGGALIYEDTRCFSECRPGFAQIAQERGGWGCIDICLMRLSHAPPSPPELPAPPSPPSCGSEGKPTIAWEELFRVAPGDDVTRQTSIGVRQMSTSTNQNMQQRTDSRSVEHQYARTTPSVAAFEKGYVAGQEIVNFLADLSYGGSKTSEGLPLEEQVTRDLSSYRRSHMTSEQYVREVSRETSIEMNVHSEEIHRGPDSCNCELGEYKIKKQLVATCADTEVRLQWFKDCFVEIRKPLDSFDSNKVYGQEQCGPSYKQSGSFLQNEQNQSTVNNAYGSMGLILAMASFAFVMKKFNDIRMHML